LRLLFERYNFRKEKVPYAPISLYFNFWHEKPDILLEERNDIICINKVDTSRIWLNYSDGWIENVKQWIIDNFTNKSNYEKS
jgi:hypothetical protein